MPHCVTNEDSLPRNVKAPPTARLAALSAAAVPPIRCLMACLREELSGWAINCLAKHLAAPTLRQDIPQPYIRGAVTLVSQTDAIAGSSTARPSSNCSSVITSGTSSRMTFP